MAYEEDPGQREFTSGFMISWCETGKQMRLNSPLARHLRHLGWERVKIFLDAAQHRIALVRSSEGRKIALGNADQCSISCEPVLRHIRTWGYPKGRWIVWLSSESGENRLEINLRSDQIHGSLNHIELTKRSKSTASTAQADSPDPSTH